MNWYLDTEFYERGPYHPIQLISIGIVAEDGREYYAELDEVAPALLSPWLKQNVVPHLKGGAAVKSRNRIASDILNLVAADKKPVFWAYFGDYDWVVFAQLFGTMVNMPSVLPHMARDLKQELLRLGIEKPAIPNTGVLHNALEDARWNKALHAYIKRKEEECPHCGNLAMPSCAKCGQFL